MTPRQTIKATGPVASRPDGQATTGLTGSLTGRWKAALIALVLAGTVLPPAAGAVAAYGLESGLTGELRQAQAQLQAGRQLLEEGYRRQDPALVQQASASFERSLHRFTKVDGWVRGLRRAPGMALPGPLQARIHTVRAVVGMGIGLNRAALTAAQALVESMRAEPDGSASGERRAERMLMRLDELRRHLVEAERAARAIELDLVPASARGTVASARGALSLLVKAMEATRPSLPALVELLGFAGPRTYLVLQANPAELRSGGGFIGTVSVVTADRGLVKLQRSVPVEEFDFCDASACANNRPWPGQPGYVAPPAELAGPPLPQHSRLTAWSLEDSGFYPDFESNAGTAAAFAERTLHLRPDGVIGLDFHAIAPALEVLGPVELPELRLRVDAANFVDVVMKLDLDRHPEHKEMIGVTAGHLVERLSRLPLLEWPRLLQVLQRGVRERHVQIWMESDVVRTELSRLRWMEAAALAEGPDFMLETEDNYGGSKANFFLERRYRLTLTRSGSTLHHELLVDLTDRAPADREYIGPHYYAYVRLYLPASATNLAMRSPPSPEYLPVLQPARRSQTAPPGTQVLGGWIFIDVGNGYSGHHQVVFTYETPWSPGREGHVLRWRKQPGTQRDAIQVIWNSGSASSSASSDLAVDRLVTVSEHGVGIEEAPRTPVIPMPLPAPRAG